MKVFRSKFGYEIILFVSIIFLITLFIPSEDSNPAKQWFFMVLSWGLVIILIIYLNLNTKYIIQNGFLIVKCGFLVNKKYEINKIKSIAKSYNLISAPAPSLDRIELKYERFDELILSPKDKNAFAEELVKINPGILNKLE